MTIILAFIGAGFAIVLLAMGVSNAIAGDYSTLTTLAAVIGGPLFVLWLIGRFLHDAGIYRYDDN